jgi:hypothetical protein
MPQKMDGDVELAKAVNQSRCPRAARIKMPLSSPRELRVNEESVGEVRRRSSCRESLEQQQQSMVSRHIHAPNSIAGETNE